MRKRKSLKKDEDSEGSEPAGEPEEFQDSGEDWTPDADSVMCSFRAFCYYNQSYINCPLHMSFNDLNIYFITFARDAMLKRYLVCLG